eukprot:767996-Hanusia_phi.AAC.7
MSLAGTGPAPPGQPVPGPIRSLAAVCCIAVSFRYTGSPQFHVRWRRACSLRTTTRSGCSRG